VKRVKATRVTASTTAAHSSTSAKVAPVAHPHLLNEELWFEGLEGFSRAQPATVKWIKECDEELFEIGVQFF
jgi:hypothetical protein